MVLNDEAFRARLRELLERTGRSQRALSGALGRDPTYVQALLDPSRPGRARPTPADLLRASDALGIRLVELLELLWDIPPERLAAELAPRGEGGPRDGGVAGLSEADRRSAADFVAFLRERQVRAGRRRRSPGQTAETP